MNSLPVSYGIAKDKDSEDAGLLFNGVTRKPRTTFIYRYGNFLSRKIFIIKPYYSLSSQQKETDANYSQCKADNGIC